MNQPPLQYEAPKEKKHADSLVILNTGDGRGKSTSAWGIMVRALARGWKVGVVQFMKSGKWKVGEETIGTQLGVDWWHIGAGFTWQSSDLSKDEAIAKEAWEHSKAMIEGGAYDLVILDEITYPINWNWISCREVVETIRNRPPHVNVVLTGRDASTELIDVADTVSRVENVKHAFQSGIMAKRGIDF